MRYIFRQNIFLVVFPRREVWSRPERDISDQMHWTSLLVKFLSFIEVKVLFFILFGAHLRESVLCPLAACGGRVCFAASDAEGHKFTDTTQSFAGENFHDGCENNYRKYAHRTPVQSHRMCIKILLGSNNDSSEPLIRIR